MNKVNTLLFFLIVFCLVLHELGLNGLDTQHLTFSHDRSGKMEAHIEKRNIDKINTKKYYKCRNTTRWFMRKITEQIY